MRINNKSIQNTKLIQDFLIEYINKKIPFTNIVIEREIVNPLITISNKKISIDISEYYQNIDNPTKFYLNKLEESIIELLIIKLKKIINSLPKKETLSDYRTINLSFLSKEFDTMELDYNGKPFNFIIDAHNSYVTLEDFDEETKKYETMVFLNADFFIPPSQIDNVFISHPF